MFLSGCFVEEGAGGVAHCLEAGGSGFGGFLFTLLDDGLVAAHDEVGGQSSLQRGVEGGSEARGFDVEDGFYDGGVGGEDAGEFGAHHLVDGFVGEFLVVPSPVAEAILVGSESAVGEVVALDASGEFDLPSGELETSPAYRSKPNKNCRSEDEFSAAAAL